LTLDTCYDNYAKGYRPAVSKTEFDMRHRHNVKGRFGLIAVVWFGVATALCAQTQGAYTGTNATGQLLLVQTVNLLQVATSNSAAAAAAMRAGRRDGAGLGFSARDAGLRTAGRRGAFAATFRQPGVGNIAPHLDFNARPAVVHRADLSVNTNPSGFGFGGLTNVDQRNADGGNQFDVEPPSPGIAIGGGFIFEGVNNAVQVYNTAGTALLPAVVTSNQLFGLAPAVDWTTNVYGPFPTDMRVFYDPDISRWFVLQWAALNNSEDNALPESQEWIAVSQTSDPTGTWNVYSIDTTDTANPLCGSSGCLPDYPQIGADKYGFYICSNEYGIFDPTVSFLDATILAISKAELATGVQKPALYRFLIPDTGGVDFSIQPATTPPGGSYFLADGGVEYLVSSTSTGGTGLAVWALSNTSSLGGTNPNLSLNLIATSTLTYAIPSSAAQRPGPQTLLPFLPRIDGNDCRVLSAFYTSARLYVAFAAGVVDQNGNNLVGGVYMLVSPLFRNGTLAATVLDQGYLVTTDDSLLRTAWAVNSQGVGAIAATLVGPDYYPSAAYIPADASSPLGTVGVGTIQEAAAGLFPEDGFTAETDGVARWGDDSAAIAAADGSVWIATEYIPGVRTPYANWGTFVAQYIP
jgi:hypothetical protein